MKFILMAIAIIVLVSILSINVAMGIVVVLTSSTLLIPVLFPEVYTYWKERFIKLPALVKIGESTIYISIIIGSVIATPFIAIPMILIVCAIRALLIGSEIETRSLQWEASYSQC